MTLQEIILRLHDRSREILDHLPDDSPLASHLRGNLPSLTLAKSVLEKVRLHQTRPDHPLQLVVLGPTQSGKSTIVNLLMDQEAAGVSPLAGYTIHPQAFLYGIERAQAEWLKDYFPGQQQLPVADLPRDHFDCIGVEFVQRPASSFLSPSMVWDTPDFDSITANHYRDNVIRTAALADVLLIVVSKDKYADESVWEMLQLLEPLEQPTLVCINKVRPSNRETLLHSWQEKWQRYRNDPPPPVVTLEYMQALDLLKESGHQLLARHVPPVVEKADRKRLQGQIKKLARKHWPAWTEPLRAEIQAQEAWRKLVDKTLEQALEIYRHDYLDHPYAYETFQRALAELLILLEVPGLAKPMMYFRKAITWPIRALFKRKPKRTGENIQELVILQNAVEHALLQLQQATQENSQAQATLAQWWQALANHLRQRQEEWKQQFQSAVETYYQDFQPQVEAAAKELYHKLEEMPATLNSLRATRVTADAAALAVVFHTGGIGPQDFVLAPAVLSITSLLTESALGKYLDRVAEKLKKAQLQSVRELLERQLQQPLEALPQYMHANTAFGIDSEDLEAAEKEIQEKPYGLKSFFQ